MRLLTAALILASLLLVACSDGGKPAGTGSTGAAATADGMPASLPATVEGEVFFDLGESELDESDLNASMTADIGFDPGGDKGSVMLRVPGDKLKAIGAEGDGERVRVTISSKTSEHGTDYYLVTAIERI